MPALRLSVDPPAGKVMRVVYGLVLTGWLAVCVLIFRDYGLEPALFLLSHPPDWSTWTLTWLWAWASVLIYGVGGPALSISYTLYAIRTRATLDGTVLQVRGILRTRCADLAVARVRGETIERGDGTAQVYLIASPPGCIDEVRLDMGTSARILPRPQLAALADAVAAGGPDDEDRLMVAERLRLFVRQPYAVPRYLWADPPPLPRR